MRRAIILLSTAVLVAGCSAGDATGGPSTTGVAVTDVSVTEGSTTGPSAPATSQAPTSSSVDDGTTTSAPGTTSTAPPGTAAATTVPRTTAPATTVPPNGGDRPWTLFTPSGYRAGTPTALVIMLHAFTASGAIEDAYLGIQAEAQSRGFLYVRPDGTKNIVGQRFWNATDACCGFRSTVDDVAYITSIIDAVAQQRTVDPRRIFLIGHSNGAFMSYRMACDLSGRIAAIAVLAGATWLDPAKCAPTSPVSVLHVHGTADETIAYAGGTTPIINGTYPGAERTTELWAGYSGCSAAPAATGETVDIEATVTGKETEVRRATGCPSGIDVELWVVQAGRHVPGIVFPDGSRPMTDGMLDFLFAHPKPA